MHKNDDILQDLVAIFQMIYLVRNFSLHVIWWRVNRSYRSILAMIDNPLLWVIVYLPSKIMELIIGAIVTHPAVIHCVAQSSGAW